jgi:ribonuclease BN (tRNA processing enzyme)
MILNFYGNHGWITDTDNHSCFSIYGKRTKILFDAGSPAILTKENVDLDAIFLSHIHFDHIKNLYNLIAYMNVNGRKKELVIYTPVSLEGKISHEIIPHADIIRDFNYRFETKMPVKIGEFDVSEMKSKQNTEPAVDVYVYKISSENKNVVYATDTALSEEIKKFSKDADLLICDASVPDGSEGGRHMSPKTVKELADYAKPGKLVLTHFDMVKPQEFKKRVNYRASLIAKQGLKIKL